MKVVFYQVVFSPPLAIYIVYTDDNNGMSPTYPSHIAYIYQAYIRPVGISQAYLRPISVNLWHKLYKSYENLKQISPKSQAYPRQSSCRSQAKLILGIYQFFSENLGQHHTFFSGISHVSLMLISGIHRNRQHKLYIWGKTPAFHHSLITPGKRN